MTGPAVTEIKTKLHYQKELKKMLVYGSDGRVLYLACMTP